MQRKIVNIAAVSRELGSTNNADSCTSLFALADDGSVWEFRQSFGSARITGEREWRQVPPLPIDRA